MNENGQLTDVLIKDQYQTDSRTGIESFAHYIIVWADKGLNKIIRCVAGVSDVSNVRWENEYYVFLDPRYDREFVKKEIEAAILCREDNNQ